MFLKKIVWTPHFLRLNLPSVDYFLLSLQTTEVKNSNIISKCIESWFPESCDGAWSSALAWQTTKRFSLSLLWEKKKKSENMTRALKMLRCMPGSASRHPENWETPTSHPGPQRGSGSPAGKSLAGSRSAPVLLQLVSLQCMADGNLWCPDLLPGVYSSMDWPGQRTAAFA